ncbi:MAG TPA: Dps family protein [Ferruginibacter sp.]|nr:DNA starvation/stationary phase protection protein [Chitinophagaceae bacterium]HML57929.1 Dps family protein [Ferruginibacter sp.]HRN91972.1 Dps family protein [Ferruginibacter sp.]HRO06857.1 Dps family protein [Ferruginibacter sp.]HRO96255.1 Dps family protein [Ferruginibacter sp.]
MNKIGLDAKKSKAIAASLNDLLANYMVFYQNTRGFHWNIKGNMFFELHLKFEELYNNLLLKIDEVAERILTLGAVPLHTFDDYSTTAQIKAAKNISDGEKAVKHILDAFQVLITKQRALAKLTADADDEGTNALVTDYLREQEKMVWMYSAFISK